jgi:CheY-like chemotaxis protein
MKTMRIVAVELALAGLAEYRLTNEVVVARDGAEALDYLKRRGQFADRPVGGPMVILLDLKMPKVDGIEVLREVKSAEETRAMPVVVLTSSAEERDIAASYMLGVNSYIVKPVDFVKFVDEVAKAGCYWVLLNRLPGDAPGASR